MVPATFPTRRSYCHIGGESLFSLYPYVYSRMLLVLQLGRGMHCGNSDIVARA